MLIVGFQLRKQRRFRMQGVPIDMQDQKSQPGRPTAERCARVCIAAVVILASAGTGFAASRLWPLPASLTQSMLKGPQTSPTALATPKPLDIPSPPHFAMAVAPSSEPGTSPSTPTSMSFTVINQDAAELPHVAAQQPLESVPGDAKRDNLNVGPLARPRDEKPRRPRIAHNQKTENRRADVAQPAPAQSGYQHDRAMREFMSPDQSSSR
jgi:hypothetical protein